MVISTRVRANCELLPEWPFLLDAGGLPDVTPNANRIIEVSRSALRPGGYGVVQFVQY
jgi:hypothetical protein